MGRTRIARDGGAADTARLCPGRAEPEICRPLTYLAPRGEKRFSPEGWNRGNICGAYVHGIFDAPGIGEALARALAERKGLSWKAGEALDYEKYRQRQYDKLADGLRESLDMEKIYEIMGL